jgi:DNA helicase-2/ATP-dependent DNA helicase PcrA
MTNYETELNPQQLEAVQHTNGPLLIIAGAGSGKTRVLTYRISHLLETVAAPTEILAITFTNKAAREMRERVESLVGSTAGMWISTFHSACVRMLRRNGQLVNCLPGFSIYDDQDQLVVIRACLKELDLDDKKYHPRAVLSAISKAKNMLQGPEEFGSEAKDLYSRRVAEVYKLYAAKLRANNALDFDDLLAKAVELLETQPQVLSYYQNRFKYIHVDEYQDTNHAQYRWVNLLARAHRNICVVGDDDQSIYLFRGADVGNILDFEKDYPEAKVIKLEQNYRSTGNILGAANSVIANNSRRKVKELWTAAGQGEKIQVYNAGDERDEANFIVREITGGARPLGDYAILFRTRAQSRALEDAFIKAGLPYQLIGGLPFYGRKEIKDMLAYLKILANPLDGVSLARIINEPRRGIGERTVSRLLAYAEDRGMAPVASLAAAAKDIGGRTGTCLGEFAHMLADLDGIASESAVTITLQEIMHKTGYVAALNAEESIEAQSRLENLQELLTVTEEFDRRVGGDLGLFLEEVSLVADVDSMAAGAEGATLITLHSAKGLEFPAVFMVGMEEGLFPHSRSLDSEEELNEERRLCYVGMTRAREELSLVWARTRHIFGRLEACRPSRFLREISEKYLDYLNGSPSQIKMWAPISQPPKSAAAKVKYVVGMVVEHSKWGQGRVIETSVLGDQPVILVEFSGGDRRRLMADFAPLTVVEG